MKGFIQNTVLFMQEKLWASAVVFCLTYSIIVPLTSRKTWVTLKRIKQFCRKKKQFDKNQSQEKVPREDMVKGEEQ